MQFAEIRMAEKITFRKGADTANFNLNNGRVRVSSVLLKFNTELVEYEDSPGSYTVLDADNDGWSLERFSPGAVVAIQCDTKSGENHDVRQNYSPNFLRSLLYCQIKTYPAP